MSAVEAGLAGAAGERPATGSVHPSDASPFAIRGVIEGYYGAPWTHAQRLRLIDELGARGMNAFLYGPKDDPLVRRDWRLPYDGEALGRLRELVERGVASEMALTWCISPGLSIRYSDPADVAALVAKLRSVAALGVRRFGLFLDDIPGELQHAADRAAYPDLAAAHVALIGAVFAALRPDERLIVCPLVYCGTGTEPYLHALADIDPRIDIFWTGRAICSPTLDLADATVLARTIRRPPTYWDNYPVNDVAMGYELHVGPYRGRDPLLWRAATGIVANGMELFESSRIPFLTIADYLADPIGYDPESSRQRAIEAVAGPADADAYAIFADNVRSSCLGGPDAPVVGAAIEAARFELADGRSDDASRRLAALASRLLGAADHLLRGPVANPGLIEEARPWLEAFALGARAIGRISALAGDGRIGPEGATDPDAAAELRQALFMLRRARVRVFGDVLEMTLAELSGTMIRPGVVPELEGGNR